VAQTAYDVLIVGGSIAGCVAALCYAKRGLRVLVLERKEKPTDYKALCTHFVQPIAYPTLTRLCLHRRFELNGAIRTKAAFWTRAGWIDPVGDYNSQFNGAGGSAYNIERRVLDPLLRAELNRFSNIELRLGHRVVAVCRGGAAWRVDAVSSTNERTRFHGALLVAADGRASPVASFLSNSAISHENQRRAHFAYFSDVPSTKNDRSLFLLKDTDMGFIYPLSGNRALLAVYIHKAERNGSASGLYTASELVGFFSDIPDMPDLSRASALGRVLGYLDYPNLARNPVWLGAAFCGDAALSLDPMSGVGCSFAMVSAELLAESTWRALQEGGKLEVALEAYESAFNALFSPHAQGIRADSLVAKSAEAVRRTYARIVADSDLQQEFIALTGRLITPSQFQRAYLGSLKKSTVAV
jgi:flavin-dependent dehydrogenase